MTLSTFKQTELRELFSAYLDGEATQADIQELAKNAKRIYSDRAFLNDLNLIARLSNACQTSSETDEVLDVFEGIMEKIEDAPTFSSKAQFKMKVAPLGWRTYLSSFALAASTIAGLIVFNVAEQSPGDLVSGSDTPKHSAPALVQATDLAQIDTSGIAQAIDLADINEFDEDVSRLISKHFMYSRLSGGSAADINYIQAQFEETGNR